MKTLVTVIASLSLFAISANAHPVCETHSRIVGHTECGTPIYATYEIVGHARCGDPIFEWVTHYPREVEFRSHHDEEHGRREHHEEFHHHHEWR